MDWLPKTASNVSFYIDQRFYVYEFSISKNDFIIWAKENDLQIEELDKKPLTITRYLFYTDTPIEGMDKLSEEEQFIKWEAMTKATIVEGYSFDYSTPNNLINISGGYDLSAERVYYISR